MNDEAVCRSAPATLGLIKITEESVTTFHLGLPPSPPSVTKLGEKN